MELKTRLNASGRSMPVNAAIAPPMRRHRLIVPAVTDVRGVRAAFFFCLDLRQ